MENNTSKSRFELKINDEITFANYRQDGDTLYIDHVEAPPALRGTGAAGQLMQEITDMAKEERLEIIPICGYAATWIKRYSK